MKKGWMLKGNDGWCETCDRAYLQSRKKCPLCKTRRKIKGRRQKEKAIAKQIINEEFK